jgi:hypothetical protein
MDWKDTHEELNLDSKLREFFPPQCISNLHMADKSVYFTRFSANLVPKVLNAACAILAALQGNIASKSLLFTAQFMPIYGKGVYLFDLQVILCLPKSSGD